MDCSAGIASVGVGPSASSFGGLGTGVPSAHRGSTHDRHVAGGVGEVTERASFPSDLPYGAGRATGAGGGVGASGGGGSSGIDALLAAAQSTADALSDDPMPLQRLPADTVAGRSRQRASLLTAYMSHAVATDPDLQPDGPCVFVKVCSDRFVLDFTVHTIVHAHSQFH